MSMHFLQFPSDRVDPHRRALGGRAAASYAPGVVTDRHRPVARRGATSIVGLLALVLAAAGACSTSASDGGDGTDGSTAPRAATGTSLPLAHATATTAPAPGAPVVLDAQAPASVACAAEGTTQVPISYSTADATQVAVLVDGTQAPGLSGADGERTVDVPCDGRPHVLVVVAIGEDGTTGTQSIVVTTESFGAPPG